MCENGRVDAVCSRACVTVDNAPDDCVESLDGDELKGHPRKCITCMQQAKGDPAEPSCKCQTQTRAKAFLEQRKQKGEYEAPPEEFFNERHRNDLREKPLIPAIRSAASTQEQESSYDGTIDDDDREHKAPPRQYLTCLQPKQPRPQERKSYNYQRPRGPGHDPPGDSEPV